MELRKKRMQKIYKKLDSLSSNKDNVFEYYKYVDELVDNGEYGIFEQVLYEFYNIEIFRFPNVNEVKKRTWDDICFRSRAQFLKKLKVLYDKNDVYQQAYSIYTNNLNIIEISLSDPMSITYSNTGATPSINFNRLSNNINIEIYDEDIYSVQIYKTTWVDNEPTEFKIIESISNPTSSTQSIYPTQIPNIFSDDYLIRTYKRPNYEVNNYKLSINREPFLGTIKEIENYNPGVKYYIKNKQFARLIGEVTTFLEVTKNGATSSIIVDEIIPTLSIDDNLINRYELALNILLT